MHPERLKVRSVLRDLSGLLPGLKVQLRLVRHSVHLDLLRQRVLKALLLPQVLLVRSGQLRLADQWAHSARLLPEAPLGQMGRQ